MRKLLFAAALAFGSAPAFGFQAAAPAAQSAPAPAPAPAPPAPPAAPAAPLPDANPALWVVRDADTTIYLFGTFHLLDGRPWFNDEIRTAFDASDELVMEAILPEDQLSLVPMIRRYAIDPTGRKLSDRLSAEDNRALASALAPLGAPATAFDAFEPWYAAIFIQVAAAQGLGVSAANGPETILSQAARARHIPIGELEGLEWQMRLFDTMPEPLQLAQLHQSLRETESARAKLATMLTAWSMGDIEGLVRIIDDPTDENPELRRLLLTDRNATWARWIQQRLARPGTVFIAVGAAHLAGRDSVQAALEAHAIHLARVPHVPTAH
jgi:uncharacterized protein YbaP (TraB family)